MKAIPGRYPLRWLVVNPDGNLLAILDSSSEAFRFTRNRGHANLAEIEESEIDYAQAPALLAALEACVTAEFPGESCGLSAEKYNLACSAIAKATN